MAPKGSKPVTRPIPSMPRPRWLDVAIAAILAGYLVAIAIVLWQHLWLPIHDDEVYFAQTFEAFRTAGWLASLRAGDAAGYYALALLAGGDVSFLFAGRALSIIALVLLAATLWRFSIRLGVSPFARRLSLLAWLNVILAGHGSVMMAIADSVFTVTMLWVLIGIERAIEDRRPRLAIAAGAGWALTWLIRPLAVLYTPAILCGIGILIWRADQRRSAARLAARVVLAAAAGILLAQSPSLVTNRALALENRNSPGRNYTELRYLSRMRFEETGGTLVNWIKIPVLQWADVRLYKQQHGEGALPRATGEALRWSPWRTARDFLVTLGVQTPFYLVGLLGVLAPLAWGARWSSPPDRVGADRVTFFMVTMAVYAALLAFVVAPFLEWRWLLLPCSLTAWLGGFALDRLQPSHPRAAECLAPVQVAFFCVSLAFWTSRVLMVRV